jgi:hypothetical protein
MDEEVIPPDADAKPDVPKDEQQAEAREAGAKGIGDEAKPDEGASKGKEQEPPAAEAKKKPLGPTEDQRKILKTAARDVRILISYLARRQQDKLAPLQVDPSVADRVMRDEYTSDLEQQLWADLGKLSDAAAPASAESIADSNYYRIVFGSPSKESSATVRNISRIKVIAWIVFGVAFLLGIYASVTDRAMVDLGAKLAERDKILVGQYEGTRVERLLQINTDGQQNGAVQSEVNAESAKTAAGGQPNAGLPSNGAAEDEQEADAPEELARSSGEAQPATDRSRLLGEDAMASFALTQVETEIGASFNLLWLGQLMTGQHAVIGDVATSRGSFAIFNTVLIDLQSNINNIVANFIIPMLAAFLGVVVYIIRDTTIRLESVALSPMDADSYWPRMILGLIAGLTIGWWLTPSAIGVADTAAAGATVLTSEATGIAEGVQTVLQGLSKTALAFVVGYSVEVLFNILDAIKAALGVKDEKPDR